jgi:hypothetical protein
MLAIAASWSYHVYQTDIVQAFLHGMLDDVDIIHKFYLKPSEHNQRSWFFLALLIRAL